MAMLMCVIVISGDILLNSGPSNGSFAAAATAALQYKQLPAFDLLTPTMLQRITTPGDGHCLFHAISLSLKYLNDCSLFTK